LTDDCRLKLVSRLEAVLRHHPGADEAILQALRAAQGGPVTAELPATAPDVAAIVLSILAQAGLLQRIGEDPLEDMLRRRYRVFSAENAARVLEDVWTVARVRGDSCGFSTRLLRTWPFSEPLSGGIARETDDLDLFVIHTLSEATDRVLMVSPYLNIDGAERLAEPIRAALGRAARVDLITHDAHRDGPSRAAAHRLWRDIAGTAGPGPPIRLKLYSGTETDPMIHAKLLLVDGLRGYLGSANLTRQGFREHLEIGVSLAPPQVLAAERLFRYIIQLGLVTEVHEPDGC
jgi:phosphatidylserine/phosphatidylglycerophosphate/cardiolipin synthase-like enzyme